MAETYQPVPTASLSEWKAQGAVRDRATINEWMADSLLGSEARDYSSGDRAKGAADADAG
ncbi:hypothetical protein [Gordonia sputi]|uniref:hypothetical protein n=1 Tax=Gordonia sputi TaxID=36823 RepID=UPI00226DF7F1|nr:hypothetical protein [Gordonia sputi]